MHTLFLGKKLEMCQRDTDAPAQGHCRRKRYRLETIFSM